MTTQQQTAPPPDLSTFGTSKPPVSPFSSTDRPWSPPPPAATPVSPFSAHDAPIDLSAYGTPKPATPPVDPGATPVSPFNPGDALGQPADLSAYGTTRPVSTDPIDAARNSAGSIVTGIGKFGNVVDTAIAKNLPGFIAKGLGATGDLQNGTDQSVVNAGTAISGPNEYTPAPVHQLGADVAGGHPLDALRDAAGVVAGAAPYAATAMIPGAGPALLGVSGAGNTIAAREQAKGTTSPTFGDVAAGATSGVLNAIGGGVAHGLTSEIVTPTLEKLLGKSLAAQLGARMAVSGAAGGSLGAANNITNTAGAGGVTASSVGQAAVEGAGTGGLAGAVGAAPGAAHAGLSLAGDTITSKAQGPITDAHAASIARIVPDLTRFADPANNLRPNAPLAQKAAAYSKTLSSQTLALGSEIAARPGVPDNALTRTIRPLISAAAAHNTAVPVDLLRQFDELPLDEPTRTTFRNAIADLDTLSQGKLLASQSGPFESIGSKAAGAATTLALLSHSPVEAAANLVAGHAAENKLGGTVGGVVDKVMGTSKPVLMAQARSAVRQALASGQPIGPSSLDATKAATTALQDANATTAEKQAAQSTQALMRPTVAALTTYGPNHPVGKAALQQLQAHGASDLAAPAITQFAANQPVAQVKADIKNQAAADAQNAAQAQVRRRADAAAALTPLATAQGKIDTATTRNQTALDAAELRPQTATPTGLTAVNAAVNQMGRQASAVRAIGGEGAPRQDVPHGVTGESPTGLNAEAAPLAPAAGRPAGESPRTFTEHLIGRAGDEHGVALSAADVKEALTQATASGALTPHDYQRVTGNLNSKLDSGQDWHTANIILRRAVDAKASAGVAVRGVRGPAVTSADTPAIWSPTRYGHTVETHQAHLNDVAAQADSVGDPELADVARALRVTKDVAARRALRDSITKARLGRGDILGASRVRTLLPDSLIDAGMKD